MENIIVIHSSVKDKDILTTAIHSGTTIIDYYDYQTTGVSVASGLTPTEENIAYLEENQVNQNVEYFDISAILSNVTATTEHIAFIYEYPGSCVLPFFPDRNVPHISRYNYQYYSDNFIDFLHELRMRCEGDITVDLLSCDLNHPAFINETNAVQIDTGITIRYSLDKTGGPPLGDWILESDDVNVRDLYFNEQIADWAHTLNTGIQGVDIEAITSITKVGNTYFLTNNIVWDPAVIAGITAATDYIILGPNEVFDGKGHTITFPYETNGLFSISAFVDSSANMPTVKNLNVSCPLDHQGGGIVRANQAFFRVENCTHSGNIGVLANVATGGAGGIIGYNCANSGGYIHVSSCYTVGNIYKLCGGIAGRFFARGGTGIIERCYTLGGDNTIPFSPPTLESGGIVGHQSGGNGGRIEIRDCNSAIVSYYNSGGIISPYAGGNFGGGNGYVLIERCYTTGDTVGINAGGIEGGFSGFGGGTMEISGCYTTGRIVNSGGISGARTAKNNGTLRITNCYTTGHIVCTNNLYFSGGITGWQTADGGRVEIRNCYALGVVTGPFQSSAGALCAGPVGSLSSGLHGRAYVYNSYGNNHKIFGSISTASSIVKYNTTTVTSANVAATTGLSIANLVGTIDTTGQVTTGDITNITQWDTTNHWMQGTSETAYSMYQNKNKDGNLKIPATGTLTGVRAVSFWIYVSYDTTGYIFDARDTVTNGYFNRANGIGAGITVYYLNGQSEMIQGATGDFTAMPQGRWNHIYLEFAEAANTTVYLLASNSNAERIDAAVSDIAFWNDTLTGTEVEELYGGEVDVGAAKLAYYYSLSSTLNAHTGGTPASVSGTTYWSASSRRNDMPRLKVFTQGEWDGASYVKFSNSATHLVPIPTPNYGGVNDDEIIAGLIFAYDGSGNMTTPTPTSGEYIIGDADVSGLTEIDGYNSDAEKRARLSRSVKMLLEFPNFDLVTNRLVVKRTALPFSTTISNEYVEIYAAGSIVSVNDVRTRTRGFYVMLEDIDASVNIITASATLNIAKKMGYYQVDDGVVSSNVNEGVDRIYDDLLYVLGSVTGQPLEPSEPEPEPETEPPPNYTSLFTTEWVKQLGTAQIERAYNVVLDSNKNIITVGLTAGDLSGTRVDAWEMIVVKMDKDGNQIWIQQLNAGGGFTRVSAGSGVVVDSADNIIVGGYALGDFDGSSSEYTNWDFVLVKLAPNGSTIWRRQFGQASIDRLYDGGNIGIDASDNIYITGQASDDNIHVYKYDSSGSQLWDVDISSASNGYEEAMGAVVDGENNIYVIGSTTGDISGTNAGDFDVVVIKLSPNGEKQWVQQIGNSDYNYGTAIVCDASNDIYITGSTYGTLTGAAGAGDGDVFLIKMDGGGNEIWRRQVGSVDYDVGTAIATDASKNVYVVAQTYAQITQDYAGDSDIFIIKYDTAGTEITRAQIGTAAEDVPHGIVIDPSNNVIITGYTSGTLGTAAQGDRDIYVMKLSQVDNSGAEPEPEPEPEPGSENLIPYVNVITITQQSSGTYSVQEVSSNMFNDYTMYAYMCETNVPVSVWQNILSYSSTSTQYNSSSEISFISVMAVALLSDFSITGTSFANVLMPNAPLGEFLLRYMANDLFGHPEAQAPIKNDYEIISAFDTIPYSLSVALQNTYIQTTILNVLEKEGRLITPKPPIMTAYPFQGGDTIVLYINISAVLSNLNNSVLNAGLLATSQIFTAQAVLKPLLFKLSINLTE